MHQPGLRCVHCTTTRHACRDPATRARRRRASPQAGGARDGQEQGQAGGAAQRPPSFEQLRPPADAACNHRPGATATQVDKSQRPAGPPPRPRTIYGAPVEEARAPPAPSPPRGVISRDALAFQVATWEAHTKPVPRAVLACVHWLACAACTTEGIFSREGNAAAVDKLVAAFEKGSNTDARRTGVVAPAPGRRARRTPARMRRLELPAADGGGPARRGGRPEALP